MRTSSVRLRAANRTARDLASAFDGRPFLLRAAIETGATSTQVRAAVRAGTLVRLRRGVYVPTATVSDATGFLERHVLDVRAVLLDARGRVASHLSAVAVHGVPYPALRTPLHWPVHVSGPHASTADSVHHEIDLPGEHVTVVDDIPVTTLARTAVDVARSLDLPEALVVVDAVVRRFVEAAARRLPHVEGRWRYVDATLAAAARAPLTAALEAAGPVHGRRRARHAIVHADPGAENAFESFSRGVFLRAGLPRPGAGIPVQGASGRWYWADMFWDDLGVVGEADGRGKYSHPDVLYAEKERQDDLDRAGLIVVRWTFDEMARTPDLVVDRVRELRSARSRSRRAS